MRRFSAPFFALSLAAALLFPSAMRGGNIRTLSFDPPVDAISVKGDDVRLETRGFDGSSWSEWEPLSLNRTEDPTETESNLVLFPKPVSSVQLRGTTLNVTPHPIRISNAPIQYQLASVTTLSRPSILSRTDWGADESLTVDGTSPTTPNTSMDDNAATAGTTSSQSSGRIRDCQLAQSQYPAEFRITRTVTTDAYGRHLIWPQQYSPAIRLIVVHHTAEEITGDPRTPVERMRALYQYHAVSKGWGDIGYHYVIDENGQIYQGKSGGEYVVGGHAYCNNIGTIGIALMGNFDIEKPTQSQVKSLQWLLDTVAKEYDIDLTRNVLFHGKSIPPIVGHRDLLSTDCPGYYAYGVLDQIRSNVRSGNLQASVSFPPPPANATPVPSTPSYTSTPYIPVPGLKQWQSPKVLTTGLSAQSALNVTGRPGESVILSMQYQAGDQAIAPQAFLGNVFRSNPHIGLWVQQGIAFQRVGRALLSPGAIAADQLLPIRIKVQVPLDRGNSTLKIGAVVFTISSEGMRLKVQGTTSDYSDYIPPSSTTTTVPSPTTSQSSSYSSSSSSSSTSSFISQTIRILLHDTSDSLPQNITISLPPQAKINDTMMSGVVSLSRSGNDCIATANGRTVASGIVRFDPQSSTSTVTSWQKVANQYRGILECRVQDNQLILIDELSLEDYMKGLGEEPDSEPLEKQKAFAVAARTYAAYYMDPAQRKFPNEPYDGSDSPATFQKYDGVTFELKNPHWVQAVNLTSSQVLMVNNQVLRAPYFSSDAGRTLSPAEAGWSNFPHAEIFVSKPDPWCAGLTLSGHGVGMSGCGAKGQALAGKSVLQILRYYYPGATIGKVGS